MKGLLPLMTRNIMLKNLSDKVIQSGETNILYFNVYDTYVLNIFVKKMSMILLDVE